ncbi:hypothetical protein [Amnibacterium kyonggiense]|uniref:YtxH-like protein n=1 Tax=Amnibacterium kyonggiense TaxID=595671 RepID=A0A4R7FL25_9MICO|nr:hypothetical protein [Amnibacterium kyonggiense]TDS77059.1 hypothetical protein CLV52_1998 [Amnibacterium kyonggiense]
MRGTILFVVGLAAGYVVGARAGRPAYEALTERLGTARDNPTVQRVGETAKATLEEKAPQVADVAEKAASTVQGAAAAAADAAKPADAASPGVEDDGGTDAPTPAPPTGRTKKPSSGSTPSAA